MDLNDTADYQDCFACGQNNPYGLQLVFRLDDNTVVADFAPRKEYQGFPGIVHGGIVAVVLDEALNRTSMLAEHESVVFAEAQGSFMTLEASAVEEVVKVYPGMRVFLDTDSDEDRV